MPACPTLPDPDAPLRSDVSRPPRQRQFVGQSDGDEALFCVAKSDFALGGDEGQSQIHHPQLRQGVKAQLADFLANRLAVARLPFVAGLQPTHDAPALYRLKSAMDMGWRSDQKSTPLTSP